MCKYEFRVVPVPARCERKLAEDGQDPLSATLETALNALAVEGWDYVRSETVSMRKGGWLRPRKHIEQCVLVFRRVKPGLGNRSDTTQDRIEKTRSRKSRAVEDGKTLRPRRIELAPNAEEISAETAVVAA